MIAHFLSKIFVEKCSLWNLMLGHCPLSMPVHSVKTERAFMNGFRFQYYFLHSTMARKEKNELVFWLKSKCNEKIGKSKAR